MTTVAPDTVLAIDLGYAAFYLNTGLWAYAGAVTATAAVVPD